MKKLMACILFFSIALNAIPTVYGPTGLIEMPTAESVAYKQISLGIDYSIQNADEVNQDNGTFYYKFNLGTFENWEIGILGGSFLNEGVFINMKYFLMASQEEYPLAIAAGFERVSSNTDLSSYLVATKRLEGGLQLHFGFKAFFYKGLSAGAMFGSEYFLSDSIAVLADMTGQKDTSYVTNLGIRLYLEQDITIRLYAVDVAKSKEPKETLYMLGISLNKYM